MEATNQVNPKSEMSLSSHASRRARKIVVMGGECRTLPYCDCPEPWIGPGCTHNKMAPCTKRIETHAVTRGFIHKKFVL